jgi:hypothetical protein
LVIDARKYWADPLLPKPSDFAGRLRPLLAECVDPSILWQTRQRSPKELALERVEPAFHACDSQGFAARMREVFSDAPNRTGDPFWSLIAKADDYSLLFDESTLERLRSAWASLVGRVPADDLRYTEWTLFNILLDQWSASEQLEQLLGRAADALDLRDFTLSFKPVAAGLCDTVSIPEDVTFLRRAGWFLSRSPEFISSRCFSRLLDHPDSFAKSLALKALYCFGSLEASSSWCSQGWRHEPIMHPEESHWGSLLLAKTLDLDPDLAAARMHPAYIFELGKARAWTQPATRIVVDFLSAWIARTAVTIRVGLNEPLPAMELSEDLAAEPTQAIRFHAHDVAPARGVHFISSIAVWGGMFAQGDFDGKLLDEETEDEWRARIDRVSKAVDAAKHRGAYWFDRQLSKKIVRPVLQAKPMLTAELGKILEATDKRTNEFVVESFGFLVPVCGYLLETDPLSGAKLYRRLKARESAVRQITGGTELDWLDVELFAAPEFQEVAALWAEALESCKSDADLMSLSLLARRDDSREWLVKQIRAESASTIRLQRARAITLSAMLDMDIQQFEEETWLGEVSRMARDYRDTNKWAKEWFSRFLSAHDDLHAFAAFRLMLQCVDRRFWTWWEDRQIKGATEISARRNAFLMHGIGRIRNAIKGNEKSMREHFLSAKIHEGQVWPWLGAF